MDIKELFFDNPHKKYHVREVARILNVSATTASKKLELFRQEGILKFEEIYNHNVYSANNSFEYEIAYKAYQIIKYSEDAKNILKKSKSSAIILTKGGLVGIGSGKVRGVKFFSTKELEIMKRTDPNLLNELINGTVLAGEWRLFS